MKILYGVQATGNGHITRARAMAPLLKASGLDVSYLFSGRAREDLFDMEEFGDFQVREGLTFITRDGCLKIGESFKQASLKHLFRDIRELDLSDYDMVISDYEPVTAWAARLQSRKCLGLGHQYAFGHRVPRYRIDIPGQLVLRWFAPAQMHLGVHWHHFNNPILPPIIHVEDNPPVPDSRKVLVYLPFENSFSVLNLLKKVTDYEFHMHCKDIQPGVYGVVTVHPFSRSGFQANLQQAESVLCNAGFELVSEALNMGKRIMVKPLKGQVEQKSNAKALQQLNLAWTCSHLSVQSIDQWLRKGEVVRIQYPDVAAAIVQWLQEGAVRPISELSDQLWNEVGSHDRAGLFLKSMVA
ncbi:MJ1255/VC2487 family glycosyltransferase [Gynuella sunshinyii]|uniref:Glycosyl transferase,-like UDP-glucuronosyltransferase n=1 Tax=Gynuella sunshinyii YC6258 TaxID=1445510 RepID=A0A0C5W1B1_9GAMM|nr:MJ1255/VC2487 family glycosyltransferase [Gynuella sunshinyii]AJQ96474.1 glycosyl transferase,-like UDP-glucuronosyltransferase [Gynuella sunshinyii YC6258]